jgi:hypothetical protein
MNERKARAGTGLALAVSRSQMRKNGPLNAQRGRGGAVYCCISNIMNEIADYFGAIGCAFALHWRTFLERLLIQSAMERRVQGDPERTQHRSSMYVDGLIMRNGGNRWNYLKRRFAGGRDGRKSQGKDAAREGTRLHGEEVCRFEDCYAAEWMEREQVFVSGDDEVGAAIDGER